jgi:hypothetical protein
MGRKISNKREWLSLLLNGNLITYSVMGRKVANKREWLPLLINGNLITYSVMGRKIANKMKAAAYSNFRWHVVDIYIYICIK